MLYSWESIVREDKQISIQVNCHLMEHPFFYHAGEKKGATVEILISGYGVGVVRAAGLGKNVFRMIASQTITLPV